MLYNIQSIQKLLCLFFVFIFTNVTANAQNEKRVQPKWWFGQSVAANINYYNGTTQVLNSSLSVPTAFHKGQTIKPYASLLTEYRPNKVVGFMLNLAYDNRGGSFDQVMAPCNCPANLTTNISYFAIEPSIRLAPFSSAFYVFAGPTIGINTNKDFLYVQDKQTDVTGDLSNIRKTVLSAQAGLGIDIPLSKKASTTQMSLSPFASFQTNLGQSPRTTESWTVYTVRAGLALKFGTSRGRAIAAPLKETPVEVVRIVNVTEKDVQFSVRAPKIVPSNRQVKELFPLRNSVFFDQGSSNIPSRYVRLDQQAAATFKEAGLQEQQPDNLNRGRAGRQMAVYYNILNIMGDRMRASPNSSIQLSGASMGNPAEGKVMAEGIKNYLVTNFGIDASRITTEGRDKPVIPSEQPGGTRELDLLREGDRRVDIVSSSPELLLQVGGATSPFLRPVQIVAYQIDPLDTHVVFNNQGASDLLKSWNVEIKDDKGVIQNYGPYYGDQASIPGKTILGNDLSGNYQVAMVAQTKTGTNIRRESSVSLTKSEDIKQEGMRYSILFDFDKSTAIAAYEKLLSEVIAPLIPDNGTVIVHGHTDIIGEVGHNLTLSRERAESTKAILEKALTNLGKQGVKIETYGFGADTNYAPFENKFPEERFYNRTVIIDIIPNK